MVFRKFSFIYRQVTIHSVTRREISTPVINLQAENTIHSRNFIITDYRVCDFIIMRQMRLFKVMNSIQQLPILPDFAAGQHRSLGGRRCDRRAIAKARLRESARADRLFRELR